jgi:hypothetical protein
MNDNTPDPLDGVEWPDLDNNAAWEKLLALQERLQEHIAFTEEATSAGMNDREKEALAARNRPIAPARSADRGLSNLQKQILGAALQARGKSGRLDRNGQISLVDLYTHEMVERFYSPSPASTRRESKAAADTISRAKQRLKARGLVQSAADAFGSGLELTPQGLFVARRLMANGE